MNIRFLSLADQEVADIVQWYDQQSEGLGRAFLDELDRVVRLVRAYPLIAPEIEPEIRRFLFSRFPYSLIYGIDQETLVVIALAHSTPRTPILGGSPVENISQKAGLDAAETELFH